MILSHKYKFIFIKTNKTAGTSIEIALSKFCGKEDIITPIADQDEAMRRELGYPGPQNYFAPLGAYRPRDWVNLLLLRKKERFYNHIGAAQIRGYVGEDVWNSYYKFCFERNPWDRVVSQYYFRNRTEPRPSISDYLGTPAIRMLKRWGIDNYTIDGKLAVDRVCRFENLEHELEEVRVKLGLPEALALPNAKGGLRKDKRSYHDILSVKDAQTIREIFRDEIAMFGYQYE